LRNGNRSGSTLRSHSLPDQIRSVTPGSRNERMNSSPPSTGCSVSLQGIKVSGSAGDPDAPNRLLASERGVYFSPTTVTVGGRMLRNRRSTLS